jgi:hypothetical protein
MESILAARVATLARMAPYVSCAAATDAATAARRATKKGSALSATDM